MDVNQESILKELTNFEKCPNEVEEIPEILEKYLDNVARSGDIVFKWEQVRAFLKKKIEKTVIDFNESYPCKEKEQPNVKPFDFEEIKRNILNGIDSFTGAPFTIQRICELLVDPYRHYMRADKFMKGLEKNVLVVSEECEEFKPTNGNSTNLLCLNSTFNLPSTSDSINNQSQQSSTFHNGYKENENDFLHNNLPPHQQTSTIQQLDSFTTVFVTSQSASSPLERMANLPILESSPTTNSTSCPSSSQANITTLTQSVDASLDSAPKVEDSQVEPHQTLLTDTCAEAETVMMEVVNAEEEAKASSNAISSEKISEKVIIVEENGENKQIDDKLIEQLNTNTDDSKEQVKEIISSESTTIEPITFETRDSNLEPIKKIAVEEELLRTPVKDQPNELKRLCESPEDIETMKRFKSHETNDLNESNNIESTLESDKSNVIESKPSNNQSENNSEERQKFKDDQIQEGKQFELASELSEENVSIQDEILDKQQTSTESTDSENETAGMKPDELKNDLLEENGI